MSNEHLPPIPHIRAWAGRVDRECQKVLDRLARWGRLAGPIAVMPDVHLSGDVCVGTVLATRDCVLPTSVGEDLGCGMQCHALDVDAMRLNRADLELIVESGLQRIPTGRRAHREAQALPETLRARVLSSSSLEHQKLWLGARHLGTLGGGNHFIELQRDTSGQLWLTVHSGSRGIGAAIANHHAKVAAVRSASERGPLPFLELNSQEEAAFTNDLEWALEYAARNRSRLAESILVVIEDVLGARIKSADSFDVPHNFIRREIQPDGGTLVVHRKGAMPAQKGSRGVIPGSMGTASYIVEGLGNPLAYSSCSHGAGRQLSRKEARLKIRQEDLFRQMKHVVFPKHLARDLVEESPEAYKDIREILELQSDLVKPLLRLEPLAVIKG